MKGNRDHLDVCGSLGGTGGGVSEIAELGTGLSDKVRRSRVNEVSGLVLEVSKGSVVKVGREGLRDRLGMFSVVGVWWWDWIRSKG